MMAMETTNDVIFHHIVANKLILATIGFLVMCGGAYTIHSQNSNTDTIVISSNYPGGDAYAEQLSDRSVAVNNAVADAVNGFGKMEHWKYKQTTDASMFTVRSEKRQAEEEYSGLTAKHKVMNEKFQAYCHEAAFVIDNYAAGNQVSLDGFYKAKGELN